MKITIAVAAMCLVAASALAAPPADKGPKGKGHHAESGDSAAVAVGIEAMFSIEERNAIEGYFVQHPASPQRLPPGIAKNLARGKPLPPGIAKKALPGRLVSALPPRPGYQYVMAGSDVLLVEVATQVVTDILRNVAR